MAIPGSCGETSLAFRSALLVPLVTAAIRLRRIGKKRVTARNGNAISILPIQGQSKRFKPIIDSISMCGGVMKNVQSKDGTRIAYDQTGAGPAVILVAGALQFRAFDQGMKQLA